MCGIAGLWDPDGSTNGAELDHLVGAMADALHRRGPDDRGVWVDPEGRVALGHRRLSIVDLAPTGHQPMLSGDERWVVVFNGEIYNFPAIRDRLASEGVTFRGTSDTEVLLAAVARWGLEAALEVAEGMFALALMDRRERTLHLVRDRFGEKPLYVGWVGRRLAFASELKALATLPGFAPEIDRQAVALYLRRNCIPAPHTIYRGIMKVPPGHRLAIRSDQRSGSAIKPVSYWSARGAIEEARNRPLDAAPEQLTDELEKVLSASVADRMVADVPVGAFLSGGIDSSVIVALMQQQSRSRVRTFTIGYTDPAFDESKDAEAVAAHLGTDHTTMMVTEADTEAVLPELAGIWDEPFADISQVPVLLVSRLARQQVTVALSGDAGDELFAGYNRHAWLDRLWRRASDVPAPLRRSTGSLLGAIPPGMVERLAGAEGLLPARFQVRNPSTKVAKVAKVLAASGPADAYASLTTHWEDAEGMVRGRTAGEEWAPWPDGAEWPALPGITEEMLWLDLVGYLPDDILTKVDRAAMATSLETRVPFLDRSVFDLAWRMPMDVKLRDGVTKWILRQVLYRHVPPALVDRPKMGFGVPIGRWLRGSLRPWAEEMLATDRLVAQGLLDPVPIRAAWEQHLSGRRDWAYELWDILALQAWIETWRPGLGV